MRVTAEGQVRTRILGYLDIMRGCGSSLRIHHESKVIIRVGVWVRVEVKVMFSVRVRVRIRVGFRVQGYTAKL